MRPFFILLLIGGLFVSGARAQNGGGHPPYKTHRVPQQSFSLLDAGGDWKIWLARFYPDVSATWPAAARRKLDDRLKNETWDYVGKGDFHKDGTPTALLLRCSPAPDGKRLTIKKLGLVSWSNGQWRERLLLGTGGMVQEGKKLAVGKMKIAGYSLTLSTGLPAAPALHLSAVALDASGRGISEGADFYFDPDSGHYEGGLH